MHKTYLAPVFGINRCKYIYTCILYRCKKRSTASKLSTGAMPLGVAEISQDISWQCPCFWERTRVLSRSKSQTLYHSAHTFFAPLLGVTHTRDCYILATSLAVQGQSSRIWKQKGEAAQWGRELGRLNLMGTPLGFGTLQQSSIPLDIFRPHLKT